MEREQKEKYTSGKERADAAQAGAAAGKKNKKSPKGGKASKGVIVHGSGQNRGKGAAPAAVVNQPAKLTGVAVGGSGGDVTGGGKPPLPPVPTAEDGAGEGAYLNHASHLVNGNKRPNFPGLVDMSVSGTAPPQIHPSQQATASTEKSLRVGGPGCFFGDQEEGAAPIMRTGEATNEPPAHGDAPVLNSRG